MSDADNPQFDAVELRAAVITVGGGCGFVVKGERRVGEYRVTDAYVITAAHCLPHLPPCPSYGEAATYPKLLAPLGREPAIWAECLFADLVGDIAVLAEVDNQVEPEAAEAYLELTESVTPIPIADAPQTSFGWLLSLDGRWFQCVVEHSGGRLRLKHLAEEINNGMSGSPIVSANGEAIGVVCTGMRGKAMSWSDPRLFYNLPHWLLMACAQQPQKSKE